MFREMNAVGRQGQRSGASAVHHQRQYSDNFVDASSSNGRWFQSAGLQHLQVLILFVVPLNLNDIRFVYPDLVLYLAVPIAGLHLLWRWSGFENVKECAEKLQWRD